MAETLTIAGPTWIPFGGSATYNITIVGLSGLGGIFANPGPGLYFPPGFGVSADGVYPVLFTPPLSDGTYDVYAYDDQHDVYSNHLTVTVGGSSGVSSPTIPIDEIRLNTQYTQAQGGPAFSTVVIVTGSGAEQRVAQWSEGRREWSIGYDPMSRDSGQALRDFFVLRQGRARGFRFKDMDDFSSYVGEVQTKHPTAPLTSTTFQLQKIYNDGLMTHARPIYKPVSNAIISTGMLGSGDNAATQASSTVHLYNPGTGLEVTSGWTVDCSTGIITFGSAPGYVPTAIFEFDCAVRFDADRMEMTQKAAAARAWSIPIVEVRI